MKKILFIFLSLFVFNNTLNACGGCVDASALASATQQIIQNYYAQDNKLANQYNLLLQGINVSYQKNIDLNNDYLSYLKQLTIENINQEVNKQNIKNQNSIKGSY